MNNKWLKILLAASLALNLAFIGSFIYQKFFSPHSNHDEKPRTIQFIDTELQLNPAQKEEVKKIVKAFELNLVGYKQKILDQRIAIIEAMSDPDFNLQTIEEKTTQLNKLESELNLLFVDTLIQVNALLDPGQRLNFLYKLSKQWFNISPGQGKDKAAKGGNHE